MWLASFFWSLNESFSRLILVKLRAEFYEANQDEEILHSIEKEKYNHDGINHTYYGGDSRSWQRYTTEYPIPGAILTNTAKQTIQFVPLNSLQSETWYALVLLHNSHEYADSIYEDYLIPFKTASIANRDEKAVEDTPKPFHVLCVLREYIESII